jgi:integrase/recombinase XerC
MEEERPGGPRWTAVQPSVRSKAVSQLELFSPAPAAVISMRPVDRAADPRPPARVVIGSRVAGGTELERLVEAFLLSAVENPNTQRAYRANLAKATWTLGKARLGDVAVGDLVAYRAAIVTSALAPASQTQAIFSLRAFLSWAAEAVGLPFPIEVARKVLRVPKAETRWPPAILTNEETGSVLAGAPHANGLRAMLLVLLGGGLRIAELCALDAGDVILDPSGEGVVRVKGKGRRHRLVPIHAEVVAGIHQYLAASGGRRLESPGPLFLAHHAAAAGRPPRRIGTRSTRRRVNGLMRKLGISKPVRVHGLRHTFSTEIIRAGGTPFHLQDEATQMGLEFRKGAGSESELSAERRNRLDRAVEWRRLHYLYPRVRREVLVEDVESSMESGYARAWSDDLLNGLRVFGIELVEAESIAEPPPPFDDDDEPTTPGLSDREVFWEMRVRAGSELDDPAPRPRRA